MLLISVVLFSLGWVSSSIDDVEPAIVLTVLPSDVITPFVVQNNEVIYRHRDDIGGNKIIAGEIIDSEGLPIIDNIRVNIQMIADEMSLSNVNTLSYAFPGEATSYGVSGWAVALSLETNYLVWLTNIPEEEIISPEVLVTGLNLETNEAIINFVQVSS